MGTVGQQIIMQWSRRKTILAKMDSERVAHKEWLKRFPRHRKYLDKKKALEDELSQVERSIDQCVALGAGQEDFLVEEEWASGKFDGAEDECTGT